MLAKPKRACDVQTPAVSLNRMRGCKTDCIIQTVRVGMVGPGRGELSISGEMQ